MGTPPKLRMTSQREAILAVVRNGVQHPTADEVYERVRQRLPHVSLGTVYRNLAFLSDIGLIRQLQLAGVAARFDGETDHHYHVRCTRCGRVDDLCSGPLRELDTCAGRATEYEITGHRLEFVGLCPVCQAAPGEL